MNHDMFVPIATIAGFKLIKQLTTDEALIADVMKESPLVVVDETSKLIKPNFKLARNTIILRDLPTSIPVEVCCCIAFRVLSSRAPFYASLTNRKHIARRVEDDGVIEK